MKLIRIVFNIVLLSWGLGFFYFIYIIENYTLDTKTTAEAIIVFGSDKQHLYVAAGLLKFGYAPLILLTDDSNPFAYKNYLKEQGIPEYQVIIDSTTVRNDQNYALDTYHLVKRYKFYTIRLVTSAEELPRAIYETTRYLPSNVSIIPHPVSVKRKNYNFIFTEYNKYLLVILASIFGLQDEFNISYT